jgi:hypothetical protein
MEPADDAAEAVGAAAALAAQAAAVVAASTDDEGLREIFNANDPFRGVRQIPSWRRHDNSFRSGDLLRRLSVFRRLDQQKYSVTMLQSQFSPPFAR